MDMAGDPNQEYIYFIGSETLPSICYILSVESNIYKYYICIYAFTLRGTGIYLLVRSRNILTNFSYLSGGKYINLLDSKYKYLVGLK